MRVKLKRTEENGMESYRLYFWCPGCEDLHSIGPGWTYDILLPDILTVTPSILVTGGSKGLICHSYITDGVWWFLPDSTHSMANWTVNMIAIPEGLFND